MVGGRGEVVGVGDVEGVVSQCEHLHITKGEGNDRFRVKRNIDVLQPTRPSLSDSVPTNPFWLTS